jgi:hypothetical protein
MSKEMKVLAIEILELNAGWLECEDTERSSDLEFELQCKATDLARLILLKEV